MGGDHVREDALTPRRLDHTIVLPLGEAKNFIDLEPSAIRDAATQDHRHLHHPSGAALSEDQREFSGTSDLQGQDLVNVILEELEVDDEFEAGNKPETSTDAVQSQIVQAKPLDLPDTSIKPIDRNSSSHTVSHERFRNAEGDETTGFRVNKSHPGHARGASSSAALRKSAEP